MNDHKTLRSGCAATLTEKRSRFIAALAPAKNEDEARAFIARVKAEHRDARHNCFAYILSDGTVRYSDDGEPSGTAGAPMNAVLSGAGLADVVCVVTRYFGGVLLGEGGLVRAYSGAVKAALEQADIAQVVCVDTARIGCSFELYGKVSGALRSFPGVIAQTPVFGESVEISLTLVPGGFERLKAGISELTGAKAVVEYTGPSSVIKKE